mgnify:CR=1 FL=1
MSNIEKSFRCPISDEFMTDPVITESGHTYDRQSIERWLQENNRDPMTNEVLHSKQLRPNHSLRSMIQEYTQNKEQCKEQCKETLSDKERTLTEKEFIELKNREQSHYTELNKLRREVENLKNQTKHIQNKNSSQSHVSYYYTNDRVGTRRHNIYVSGNTSVVFNGSVISSGNQNSNTGTNQPDENGNINCINCNDCRNCRNCRNCSNCNDCNNCQSCNNCNDCNNCQSCSNCKDCNNCQSCSNCKDCTNCTYCINLFDKTNLVM